MLEGGQEPILRIQTEEVAQIEEVLVVEESPLPHHLAVDGVDLGYHHVQHHHSQHQCEDPKPNIGCPVPIHLRELHSPHHCLQQSKAALVESLAPCVLLEEDVEEVTHRKKQQEGGKSQEEDAGETEQEHLNKGPKETSDLEGDNEAEESEGEEEPHEVGLGDVEPPIEEEEAVSTLSSVGKLVGLLLPCAPQVHHKPYNQGKYDELKDLGLSEEELRKRDGLPRTTEALDEVGERKERVEGYEDRGHALCELVGRESGANELKRVVQSLVEYLRGPLGFVVGQSLCVLREAA